MPTIQEQINTFKSPITATLSWKGLGIYSLQMYDSAFLNGGVSTRIVITDVEVLL